MSYNSSWKSGEWKAICDVCGRIFKSSMLRKRWDGFMVCDEDWEPRHPQDFVRAKADIQAPKWTRPEAQDSFVTILTNSAIPSNFIPGMALPSSNGLPLSSPTTF